MAITNTIICTCDCCNIARTADELQDIFREGWFSIVIKEPAQSFNYILCPMCRDKYNQESLAITKTKVISLENN